MQEHIDTIMVFAAGLGSRMRHLTETEPKSLIKIGGKPILEYTFNLVEKYPFSRVVVNTHYHAEHIMSFINGYKWKNITPRVYIVHEEKLLAQAGGVHNAKPFFNGKSIFTLNSDVIMDIKENPFERMIKQWQPDKMDFLLLMQPFDKAVGYRGQGDFEIATDGKLYRPESQPYQYMYAGLTILKPEIIRPDPISLAEYYLREPKVYGTVIEGMEWYHATSPEDISVIETALLNRVT